MYCLQIECLPIDNLKIDHLQIHLIEIDRPLIHSLHVEHLELLLQSQTNIDSECISKLARSQSLSASPILFNYDLLVCYTFGNHHSFRDTRYHLMMISGGDGVRFINYKPALLPHQWPPGTCPSTTLPPPTHECCYNCDSVLIQCEHPFLSFICVKITNNASQHHPHMI